jgi:MFS family permease
LRAVLRRPDFRLLFGGLVASMIGESILLLALAVWVKDLTGSDGLAGATLFAIVAPMVLAPFVGWLVDRFRRRPFFVAVNVATAIALVPLVFVRDRGDVWIIYAVGVTYGLSYIAVSAALSGLLKEIVPAELLAEANGALQTVRQGLRLGGPLAGAGLYATVGGWALAAVAAAGFLTAAGTVAVLRVSEQRPVPSALRWRAEVGAGIRHLVTEPALRRVLTGAGIALLVLGFSESLIFAYVDQGLRRDPAFVGALVSVQGIGGLLGGFASAAVVRRLGEIGTAALDYRLLYLIMGAVMAMATGHLWRSRRLSPPGVYAGEDASAVSAAVPAST